MLVAVNIALNFTLGIALGIALHILLVKKFDVRVEERVRACMVWEGGICSWLLFNRIDYISLKITADN